MSKKSVLKEYKEKIKLITNYNQKYYKDNNPSVSDSEYDSLKKNIIELETKYEFLNDKNSPSLTVGFKPSKIFKKSFHKIPMLSLGNAFSEEDLKNFEKNSKFFR